MDKNLIDKASILINTPGERVWDALVSPEAIRQYMFGTNIISARLPGFRIGPITTTPYP